MKNSKFRSGLSILLVLALIIGIIPMNAFANTNNVEFEADFRITAEWGNSYSGEITLRNNGSTRIENWKISFESQDTIESFWDADIVERTGSTYIVKSKSWNGNINPGESVTISFNATMGSVKGVFNIRQVIDGQTIVTMEDNIFFTVTSDWGTGFNGNIEIRNTSTSPIENWSLSFDFDRTIGSVWNATMTEHTNGRYTFVNAGWNAIITPGGSVNIGFDGTTGNVGNNRPRNYVLQYDGKINSPTPTLQPTMPAHPPQGYEGYEPVNQRVFDSSLFENNNAIPRLFMRETDNNPSYVLARETWQHVYHRKSRAGG